MSHSPVIDALCKTLAGSYALYLKTQNYHWNVTGPEFVSLHTLFEEQYADLAEAVDEIAERIRALGAKAPGGLQAYAALSDIRDGDERAGASQMIADLRESQRQLVKTLNAALSQAQDAGDEATADLCIQRIQQHEKNAWMLGALLEDAPAAASPRAA